MRVAETKEIINVQDLMPNEVKFSLKKLVEISLSSVDQDVLYGTLRQLVDNVQKT